MLQTGYTINEILDFLRSIYPLDQEKLNSLLPKYGMQLTINRSIGKVRIIKAHNALYSVYFEPKGIMV